MSNSTITRSSKRLGKAEDDNNTMIKGEDLGQIKGLIETAYEYLHKVSARLKSHENTGQEHTVSRNAHQLVMEDIHNECIDNKCDYLKFVENGKFNV